MIAIYRKELRQTFSGMSSYLFIALILLFAGILISNWNFKGLYPGMESTLTPLSYIFLLVVPLLTMRVVADEKRQKTDQLLHSLPLSVWSIVCGKFFAMVTVFLIPMAIILVYPLILSLYGPIALASNYTALLGFILFGISLISVGLFASSLTENPIIAAVICCASSLAMFLMSALKGMVPDSALASFLCFGALVLILALIVFFMTKSFYGALIFGFAGIVALIGVYALKPVALEGAFAGFLDWFSLNDRFIDLLYGMVDVGSVIYFLSFSAVMVFLTVQAVEKKRWA